MKRLRVLPTKDTTSNALSNEPSYPAPMEVSDSAPEEAPNPMPQEPSVPAEGEPPNPTLERAD